MILSIAGGEILNRSCWCLWPVCLSHWPTRLPSSLPGLRPSPSEWHTHNLHCKQVPTAWPLYSSEVCRQQDHFLQGKSRFFWKLECEKVKKRERDLQSFDSRVHVFPYSCWEFGSKIFHAVLLSLCSTPYGTSSPKICLSSSEESPIFIFSSSSWFR